MEGWNTRLGLVAQVDYLVLDMFSQVVLLTHIYGRLPSYRQTPSSQPSELMISN